MKKTLLSLAVTAALGLVSATASAAVFNDFKVLTSPANGSFDFTADKITGNYTEIITFNAGNTFDVSIRWNAGQFVENDGNDSIDSSDTGLGFYYGLYLLFQGSGSVSPGATTVFSLNSGNYGFWLDEKLPGKTTTFTAPVTGAGAWTTSGLTGTDDVLLMYGSAITGTGTLDTSGACQPPSGGGSGTINCGSFGQTNSVVQTAAGSAMFYWPSPFYDLSFASGQLNSFTLLGTQTINGSMDLVFAYQPVPEPGILALMGIGLLGLGLGRLRKQA